MGKSVLLQGMLLQVAAAFWPKLASLQTTWLTIWGSSRARVSLNLWYPRKDLGPEAGVHPQKDMVLEAGVPPKKNLGPETWDQ